ncbi:hypothetical protein [Streptomyces sp. CB01580]|uniref:hypothetical protein n=1 Tax=Streptomyces sp. CB01580 TaxID=1703933 RepID=UPI00093D0881|nr:hypothetical protein [Streptomyces sp. CB01580]OKJ42295.1 hypothetical protein AMK22_05130 [Streptomyces sp. CB01580]
MNDTPPAKHQPTAAPGLTAAEAAENAARNAATLPTAAQAADSMHRALGRPAGLDALLGHVAANLPDEDADQDAARAAAIQAVKDHPSTTFMAPYESLADAVLTAASPLLRSAALLAGADAIEALPQDYECDPGRGDAVKLLRRLGDHYVTNEQLAGLSWEARAEHAVPELEQPVDGTERPEDTARRYARRLNAVEQLCNGRPGYHTITVKQLLTAVSDADDGPDPVSDDTLTTRIETALDQYRDEAGDLDDHADVADNLIVVIKQAGR